MASLISPNPLPYSKFSTLESSEELAWGCRQDPVYQYRKDMGIGVYIREEARFSHIIAPALMPINTSGKVE